MTTCEAEGLKMSTNLRYFSGKLHGGAVMSNEKEKETESVKKRVLTSGALRRWRCVGLVLSTTGCMGELADGLPQLAV